VKHKELSMMENYQRGLEALIKALGPHGYIRFMQMLVPGKGDYTKERHKWLDRYGADNIERELRKRRKKKSS
jgi:hypothetical protein